MAGAADGAAAMRVAEPFNPVQKIGFLLTMVFLYVAFSRITDFALGSLHLPLVTSILAFAATILCGGIQRALSTRVGILLTAFSFWLVVCTPFSFWKGGSVSILMDLWSKSYLLFIVVLGLTRTVKECRRLGYTIGFAIVTVTAMAFYFRSRVEEGRWNLPVGTMQNPNDLAQILLIGLPFLTLMALSKDTPFLLRLGALLSLPATFFVFFATGSRGALIALFAVCLVIFAKSSLVNRIRMIVGAFVILALMLAFLPNILLQRYHTIFDKGESVEEDFSPDSLGAATESSTSRLQLLKQSVELTIRHPIFGVGPGQFQTASEQLSHSSGKSALWRETHNSFTQVSSEAGLPAFFLYVATLFYCFRQSSRIFRAAGARPEFQHISNLAFAMLLCLIGFSVTSFFSSIAYHFYFPALAGLTMAFSLAADAEMGSAIPAGPRNEETTPAKTQRKRSRFALLRPRRSPI